MTDYFRYSNKTRKVEEEPRLRECGIIHHIEGGILGTCYTVSLEERNVGSFDDLGEAERHLHTAIKLAKFEGDCYFVRPDGKIKMLMRKENL